MNLNFTLVAQAITFALFIWFSVKVVWPYMLRAIETRQKTIADGLALRAHFAIDTPAMLTALDRPAE